MKILSITAQKPNSTGSGVYLTELVRALERMGHKQAVLAGVYQEDVVAFPEGTVFYPVCFRTGRLPFAITGMSDEMPYESTRYRDMTRQMTRQFRESFADEIKRAVEEFQPDLIFCHHLYYLTALVRELCPDCVTAAVCHGSDLRQIKKNSWEREYIRSHISKIDMLFALHEVQRREIIDLYGVPADKVRVIGTGYNKEIFYCSPEDIENGGRKNKILFAGKVSEKKGVKSLLRAFSYMKDAGEVELTLAGGSGDDKEEREIRSLAKTCLAKTVFAGRLAQTELAQCMREQEVFVLPSFYEGLPLVVIEALACGQKVVCNDLPGVREWLDGQLPDHGVLFVEPPELAREDEPLACGLAAFEKRLAEALEHALDAPYRRSYGLASISWEGTAERILQAFDQGSGIF